MNDRKDAPATGDASNPDPPSSSQSPVRTEETDRSSEGGWLDRLKAAVGLKPASFREELEEALAEDAVDEEDSFSPEERAMLRNIVRMRELRVEDIMAPRADIGAVETGSPLAEVILKFRDTGHSRLPVYRETLDEPLGMVLLKDVLNYIVRPVPVGDANGVVPVGGVAFERVALSTPLADTGLVRNVLFVPPSMPVLTLLNTMRARRMQMALVIDEFGGTDGLVSIEDAIETVVGEIEDEHDVDGPMVVPNRDGSFDVDGRAGLEDVAEAIDPALAEGPAGEEVDTIAGLVFGLLGRIPERGETVIGPGGYPLEVLATDQRRISRIRIHPRPAPDPAGQTDALPRPAA